MYWSIYTEKVKGFLQTSVDSNTKSERIVINIEMAVFENGRKRYRAISMRYRAISFSFDYILSKYHEFQNYKDFQESLIYNLFYHEVLLLVLYVV